MTSIYEVRQRFKLLFSSLAILIAISSFVVTNSLVQKLSDEEKSKMQIWANATKELINMDEYCDISFVQQVIEANTTIPVILVTQEDSVISYKNIPERLQESRKLQQLVEEYKKAIRLSKLYLVIQNDNICTMGIHCCLFNCRIFLLFN